MHLQLEAFIYATNYSQAFYIDFICWLTHNNEVKSILDSLMAYQMSFFHTYVEQLLVSSVPVCE